MANPSPLLKDDKQLKGAALARLRHRIPEEEVANELNLPLALVREWRDGMDEKDFAAANGETVSEQKLLSMVTTAVAEGQTTLEEVRSSLENAALKLSKEVASSNIIGWDIERAKTLDLMSSAMAKLYNAFFNKNQTVNILNNAPGGSSSGGLSKFIGRD